MTPIGVFTRLLKYFIRHKWRVVAGLFSVGMMSLSDVLTSALMATLIEFFQSVGKLVSAHVPIVVPFDITVRGHSLISLQVNGYSDAMWVIGKVALAVLIITLFKACFIYVREYVMSSAQQKILMRFRNELFGTVVQLPVRFFDTNKTGYTMSRVTNDVNNVEQTLSLLVEMSQNAIFALVFATVLIFTDWRLTLFTIVVFIIFGEISRKFGDRIRKFSRDLTNTVAEISAFLQEKISSIRIVKSFTREDFEKQQFKKKVEANYHHAMKIVRVMALLSPTNELFNTLVTSVIVLFTGYLFIQGTMTLKDLSFFLFIMINMAKPVKALGESAARVQKSLVSAGLIFEMLDLEVEHSAESNKGLPRLRGEVEFRNVSFSYTGDQQALTNVSLRVEQGKKIALVGPSGSGKSTMVNLIPRFYNVVSGTIAIDAIDIQNMDLAYLRSHIAIVPQEVVLFSGSIRDNIAYGRLNATEGEIISAARSANASDFIERLDHGYDTEVGERGVQLSGGQRQRIAIARAIIRDPRILLLDEATSALDTESELMVQEALDRLMRGRTSFVIAHRLSTILHCDEIFVLDHGSIVERGTHEALLNNESGLYRRFYTLQFSNQAAGKVD
jgi:ATP-binding cassette, subfamily B, bacterial MsbA